MAKMKTRDLILDVALVLFNSRGEPAVTSVDLAYEMNISPGNLYYHFKGKEEVIEELYARFHAELLVLMEGLKDVEEVDAAGMVAYLSLIAEFFERYRFISQNAPSLCDRYPVIARPLSKVLTRLHKQILGFCQRLALPAQDSDVQLLSYAMADNLLNTLMNLSGCTGLIADESRQHSLEHHLRLQLMPFAAERVG